MSCKRKPMNDRHSGGAVKHGCECPPIGIACQACLASDCSCLIVAAAVLLSFATASSTKKAQRAKNEQSISCACSRVHLVSIRIQRSRASAHPASLDTLENAFQGRILHSERRHDVLSYIYGALQ